MRIFLAGATGVIGSRLVPLLAAAGHEVVGLTRSEEGAQSLRRAGAEPVVADAFDLAGLTESVAGAEPDFVLHELTDLPDDQSRLGEFLPKHNRIRREGTANLLAAAAAAGVTRLAAQSVAWDLPGDAGEAVADLEEMVLAYPGIVLRYGQFYGPGTYYPDVPPRGPRIHIDDAASRTIDALEEGPGIISIVER